MEGGGKRYGGVVQVKLTPIDRPIGRLLTEHRLTELFL